MSTSGGAKAKTRAPQHYSDEVVLTCAVLGTSTVLRVVVDPSIIVHELMVKLYDREEIRAHCSAAKELALFLATSLNATRGETDKLSPGERIQERFPQGYPPVDVVAILVKLPTKPSSPGEPDSVEHDTHDSTPFQLETGDEEPDGDDRHGSRTRMLLVTGAVCCVIGLHVTIWTHYTAADIERAFILIGMSEANLEGAVCTIIKILEPPTSTIDAVKELVAFAFSTLRTALLVYDGE
ncbi:hypothetical protein Poli38472_003480 [Pythium oligandrum]|uniref:Uncharacterized protein n=1 Tax=Pythium oligandrum TaxID=41045 RepID=A0A8K1FBR4_PYTOL|nr:hypothetical protein Poli38472_003480 [Pythium oligandrum]|eukprot:TMW57555.1 hypothetical protein Poli38472_003480 [Pythium oligandrum]